MNKSKLARDLDISRTMLYKLEARGMPTDSLDAAIEWRRQNLDVTQTKGWRIDGNKGVKRELTQVNYSDEPEALDNMSIELEMDLEREVLTDAVPEIWFEQVGWLGVVLKDYGVKITAEQLVKVQQGLFMIYMEAVTEYLEPGEEDILFKVPPILKAKPGAEIYPSLIKRLNQVLNA